MIVYLIVTGVIGFITVVVGTSILLANIEYGLDDEDAQVGAVIAGLGLLAPITLVLAVVAVPVLIVYVLVQMISAEFKKEKE